MWRTRALLSLIAIGLAGCHDAPANLPAAASRTDAVSQAPVLSPTRHLRRIFLTLKGTEPTAAQYQQALDAADAGTFDAFADSQIDLALQSPEFYGRVYDWGHDYLRVGDYKRGTTEGGSSAAWKGGMAARLTPCGAGTLHAGQLFHGAGQIQNGDPSSVCDDSNAPVNSVEPWWSPGAMVSVVGSAGTGVTTVGNTDCGKLYCGDTQCHYPAQGCSCGPNLTYCYPFEEDRPGYQYAVERDSSPFFDGTYRRLLWEEPARLFAYLITQDQPFDDLIEGSYTVAPRKLQHIYARWGRMNSDNAAAIDGSSWWKTATDSWDKVELSSLHPNLLSERAYSFDPRTDPGSPKGVGAAGVLTMLGPASWFPRERVRAARWLETFACQNFTAPDPSIVFTPAYTNDPQSQGPCQHCHRRIDPAAIHFKRLEIEDEQPYHGQGHANFGGIGDWSWRKTPSVSFPDPNSPGGVYWRQPYGRWNVSFAANTFLTPVTTAQLMANPDARFIDFLPPGNSLFGAESDGTIGPLGFGKLMVQSGQFDHCAVDKIFEKFMGRRLDVAHEAALEDMLVQQFVSGGRKVKPFIKQLMLSDEFGRGR